LVASVGNVTVASAQTYPERAVRFILPFGPASGVDITARLIGDKLAARWGKPVVIENRPGGDGLVAINAFTSANENHTLLFVPTSTFTAHPYSHGKLPYNAEQDLLPITNVTTIVIGLGAPESLNVNTLGEFIALARAKPDTLNVAAAAGNSDLILSAFIKTQGLPVARVPYRDIQQAPNDLAEARIHLLMSSYATMRPLVQAGKLRVLAVTSRKRVGIAAEIPTVAEAGYPYLGLDSLIGIYGPRGMSNALRESIAADVRAVIEADPSVAEPPKLAEALCLELRGRRSRCHRSTRRQSAAGDLPTSFADLVFVSLLHHFRRMVWRRRPGPGRDGDVDLGL
jgi:tripartite-type tricarboxylate transporter receptor subunit TctC